MFYDMFIGVTWFIIILQVFIVIMVVGLVIGSNKEREREKDE